MEYIYSAMLLHKAGQPINEANVTKVLTAAGVKVDANRVKAVCAAVEGLNIEEAIKKAATVAAPAAAAPAAHGGHAGAEKKEEKKKEKKSAEEAAAGLGALFG